MSWMVVTGIFARYIAMALPERSEWQPISVILKPNLSSPNDAAAALIFVLI
jgi:hypothetical protein